MLTDKPKCVNTVCSSQFWPTVSFTALLPGHLFWCRSLFVCFFVSLWLNVCFVCVFQGERIEKGQGTWDPSEEPPHDVITLLTDFSVGTWDILQEKRKKKAKKKTKKTIRTAIITISAVLLVRLLLRVQQHFSHIYSFHWLDLGQRVKIITGQWQSLGWGGGGGRTFALRHSLHFFMDCFVVFRIWRDF